MNPSTLIPPPPKARSAEAHLEGLGTVVMIEMRKRIIKRLEEYTTKEVEDVFDSEGNLKGSISVRTRPYTEKEKAEFADWMIRRMAEKRLQEGQQMDSIIAASYKAFLPNLMAQAIKTIK